MAPPVACAAVALDYPLYAVDFDPEDAARLVVGGGGGAGRSGVGNKMTVLEAASPEELRVLGDVELSRDEDSVMSLAVGPRRGRTTHVYAGVNSSPADVARGTNLHLRVLGIEPAPPPRARPRSAAAPSARVAELSRAALFSRPHADTYQRLLRVAGPLGAAASAMGDAPQIAVFDAAGARPRARGVVELARDAEDLDLVQTGESDFQLAFCYKHELHVMAVGKHGGGDPELVFTMPDDHGERPVFRAIRYLTPGFLLAAANLPRRSGVLLQGFRLLGGDGAARVAVTARVPRNVAATALAVASLSPPPSPPWAPVGDAQFVVAVAGHDASVAVYTLEHRPSPVLAVLAGLDPVCTLAAVAGADNITGLAFSRPVVAKARTPMIRLASISLQKTVAVHSIPLKRHVGAEPRSRRGPPRPARHVVALRSRGPSPSRVALTLLAVVVVVLAVVGQAVMELYGRSAPVLFAHGALPSSWHGALRSPNDQPGALFEQHLVARLAAGRRAPAAGETMVLLEPPPPAPAGNGPFAVDVHDAAVHGPAKTWDELGAEQKHAWRERLRAAGAWTQAMGESVFKGVLFGQLAGAIGQAMAHE